MISNWDEQKKKEEKRKKGVLHKICMQLSPLKTHSLPSPVSCYPNIQLAGKSFAGRRLHFCLHSLDTVALETHSAAQTH